MADFLYGYNEEEDFGDLVSRCESALNRGSLSELKLNEEEFDFVINHYMNEDNGTVVYLLAEMAYYQHPYSSEMILRYVDILIVNSEPEKAIKIIEQQLSRDPGNIDLLFLYGRASLKSGNHEVAKEYINKAVSLDSEEPAEMLLTAAQDYIDDGKFDHAVDYLNEARKYQPQNNDILNDLGFCMERLDKFDESINYYEQFIEKDPFNDNVWFNLGTIYARVKNIDKAVEAFDYAAALNPENASVLYNKAILYSNAENHEKAAATFKEFLKFEPDNPYALIAMCDAYLAMGNLDEAAETFLWILELDERNIDALTGLAYIYLVKKDFYSSLAYLRRIMNDEHVDCDYISYQIFLAFQESKLPEFLVYYIVCLYRLEDIDNAIINLELLTFYDELWIAKLHELEPKLLTDKRIIKYLNKK